jgi:hypothetical protein
MPKLVCPDIDWIEQGGERIRPYMHAVGTERYFKDSGGQWRPRYRIYKCDCGEKHVLDVEQDVWMSEVPKE